MTNKDGHKRRSHQRLADMSLPTEQRRRKRSKKTTGRAGSSQAGHASNPRARRKQRDGERKMGRRSR